MARKKDFFDVLGIPRGSDDKEIKKAYRKLAKKYHPDTNQGNAEAEERFKEVTEAYETLTDPEKRRMYDQFGMDAFDENTGGGYGGQGGQYYSSGNMGDIFENLFGGGFGGFGGQGGFGGFGGFGGQMPENLDVRANLTISFEEAALGCEKMVRLDRGQPQMSVTIPAGIDEGQSVRLRGKGNRSSRTGAQGDLLIQIHILPSSDFERKGADIYTTATVPYTTAVLGGKAKIRTLTGQVEVNIPTGSQSGSKIRLRGKGIQSSRNRGVSGDLYITIRVAVPKSLSGEQRDIVEKLRALGL